MLNSGHLISRFIFKFLQRTLLTLKLQGCICKGKQSCSKLFQSFLGKIERGLIRILVPFHANGNESTHLQMQVREDQK